MTAGIEVHTQDVLIKYTMSTDAAEKVKTAFVDRSARGESLSYLDCVLFDAALDVLGLEQAYYGYGDDEWENILNERKEAESRFDTIKVINITDTWQEMINPTE